MTEQLTSPLPLTAKAFAGGVIASTLTPFEEDGRVMLGSVTDQARRLSLIDGILGIAVNTTIRERESLSLSERLEVLRHTKEGLGPKQLVLACVGELSADVEEEVAACRDAGADAVITFPPRWRDGPGVCAFEEHIARLKALADQLPLPIIAAMGDETHRTTGECPEITTLARDSRKVIGVDMGTHDNVLHYDQAYYALKAIDRPLACLPSSEAALFHNLNTGADGVVSCLAYVAPHEVTALYRATKAGRFDEAQALHNRLSPLIGLISGRDKVDREMVLRQIAHRRQLLAGTEARDLPGTLDATLVAEIDRTVDAINLAPIHWFRQNRS